METELKVGDIVEAVVTKITAFGAFIKINGRSSGLIHISQISSSFVKDINHHLKIGDKVRARIIKIGPGKRIDLSLKQPAADIQRSNLGSTYPVRPAGRRQTGFKSSDFEEKLKKFLHGSQQNLANLKKRNEKYSR